MKRSTYIKFIFAFIALVAFVCAPKSAFAQRGGGGHGGGGGGGFHGGGGGGGFHGGAVVGISWRRWRELWRRSISRRVAGWLGSKHGFVWTRRQRLCVAWIRRRSVWRWTFQRCVRWRPFEWRIRRSTFEWDEQRPRGRQFVNERAERRRGIECGAFEFFERTHVRLAGGTRSDTCECGWQLAFVFG